MLQLKLLGEISILTSEGPLRGRAAQRHRVALLCILAVERTRSMTRDKLIGYLWPETAEERARHLLSDSIYRINHALGETVLVTAGEEVRINSAVVTSDVGRFEEAMERGAFAEALATYGGSFIDGFALPDAEAFDHWMSVERERLQRMFVKALEHEADGATLKRDHASAQELLHRLVQLDPYNSRASLKHVQAVAAAGNHALALRLAEAHERLLRDELGLDLPRDYRETLQRLGEDGTKRAPDQSIAVLPFVDLSRDRDNEYFTDGITEELIGALARMPGLRVVARSSVFALKGRNLDVRETGSLLNVSWVLEGSVRKDAEQLRIAIQLVDTTNGFERWTAAYTRPQSDVLAIQEEIAAAVAQQIHGAIGRPAKVDPVLTPEAYDLFLRARYHWHRRKKADLELAVRLFQQVIERAPEYARGWAGMADAYAIAGFYDLGPAADTFERARAAARRALELDSDLSVAHISLGYIALYLDWDLAGAEALLQRAINLMPDISQAHQYYGNLLTAAGRFREAEDEFNRAQELDPLSMVANAAHGWTLHFARRYEAAEERLRNTIARDPTFHPAHCWRAWPLEQLKRYDEMITELEHAALLSPSGANRGALARGWILAGDRARGVAMMEELEGETGTYVPHHTRAKFHLSVGERADALAELGRAIDAREYWMVFIGVDPQLDPLRDSTEFARLRGIVGV